jgi:hypothetical protein
MTTVDYDAIRRDLPQLTELTDTEIQQLIDFEAEVLRRTLLNMKRRGAELLAQREPERKAA